MEKICDVCIVGGGTAGLSAALYAARSGVTTLVVEKAGICGGAAARLPRIENYPAVPDTDGYALAERMAAQARAAGAEIIFDTATRWQREDRMAITLESGERIVCGALVLATGCTPRKLGVADEASYLGAGLSYCAVCDGNFFRGKRVVVAGDGEKASEAAAYLSSLCSHVLRVVESDVAAYRETDTVRGRIVALYGKPIREIGVVTDGQEKRIAADGVFAELGDMPAASFVPDLRRDEAGYICTDAHMRTNVEGVFAAGDVRSTALRQIVTAAGDGAIAGQFAAVYARRRKA